MKAKRWNISATLKDHDELKEWAKELNVSFSRLLIETVLAVKKQQEDGK